MIGLETQEQILISKLPEDPGYRLLLSALEAEIDFAADELHRCDVTDPAIHQRALWKALRQVYSILKTEPQRIAEDLKNQEIQKQKHPMAEFFAHGPDSVGRLSEYYKKFDPQRAAIYAMHQPPQENEVTGIERID